ncbi:unnamed protein product [Absidia cylindrospora]
MAGIVAFQAVGRDATFYLVKLIASGLYVMYELGSFTVPGSIHQILTLPGYFDDIIFILSMYQTHCIQMTPSQVEKAKTMKRPTLLTPQFDSILTTTRSNKRLCITRRTH